eukprot:13749-Heterococcus_DN1.PRE.3
MHARAYTYYANATAMYNKVHLHIVQRTSTQLSNSSNQLAATTPYNTIQTRAIRVDCAAQYTSLTAPGVAYSGVPMIVSNAIFASSALSHRYTSPLAQPRSVMSLQFAAFACCTVASPTSSSVVTVSQSVRTSTEVIRTLCIDDLRGAARWLAIAGNTL